MAKELIYPIKGHYEGYLSDESRLLGNAESISFPATQQEVMQIIHLMRASKTPITIQGGKTGIVGGGVPMGGHIMNLSNLCACKEACNLPDGSAFLTVEAGVNLVNLNNEIRRRLSPKKMFWPPQPTETSATVGGVLACASQGINGCRYGDARNYVDKIRMVLSSGEVVALERSSRFIQMGNEKIDELDLILGGEGLYGVITEATLKLLPKPEEAWGISFFFELDDDADTFAQQLHQINRQDDAWIEAAEYLDRATIDLIENRKGLMTKIKDLPDVGPTIQCMIYIEIAGEETGIEQLAENLMMLASEANSDPDCAWAVSGEAEIEKMRAFRHGAAEIVNLTIEEARINEPRITKLGTDIVLSKRKLADALSYYRSDMALNGLSGCIFGHVMGTHLHVNILPKNYDHYCLGKSVIEKWSRQAAIAGEQVIAEHGIGKLKNHLTAFVVPQERISAMQALKENYDPLHLLNKGTIFKGPVIA